VPRTRPAGSPLLIDAATRDAALLARPDARFESAGPFDAKGFAEPLETFAPVAGGLAPCPQLLRQSTAEMRAEQFALGSSGERRSVLGSGRSAADL